MNHIETEIRARCQKFLDFYTDGDAKSIAEMYAEDAEFLAPDLPRFTGRAGIEKFWQKAIDSKRETFKNLDFCTFKTFEQTCIQVFTFEMAVSADASVTHTVKNVLCWNLERGEWLINLDIWNSPA